MLEVENIEFNISCVKILRTSWSVVQQIYLKVKYFDQILMLEEENVEFYSILY